MMKTRIPRTNIVRNIISKKVQRVKKVCDDKCKDELAQNNNCSMISTNKNYLKRARKYCIKSRARKCANKSFRYSLSEPKPFAKNQYIQNIKKVVSCDMKVMKKTFKTSAEQYL